MDDRITEFARGLRAAGVRVSLAETADALRAAEATGVGDRDALRRALRASLVKTADDFAAFEALFPLYFGGGGPRSKTRWRTSRRPTRTSCARRWRP